MEQISEDEEPAMEANQFTKVVQQLISAQFDIDLPYSIVSNGQKHMVLVSLPCPHQQAQTTRGFLQCPHQQIQKPQGLFYVPVKKTHKHTHTHMFCKYQTIKI